MTSSHLPQRRRGLRATLARQQSLPLRIMAHLAAALPGLLLAFDTQMGRLSVNPIQDLTLRTGSAALIMLVASLVVTPLNRLLGWRELVPLRKVLGLWAFAYALVHLGIFAFVDYGLDLTLIRDAIIEKPYVLVGFAAFLILLALALTSTRWSMRQLGKRWKPLHRLVYVASILVILHFVWLSKDPREALIYGAVVAVLLLARLPWRRKDKETRRQRARKGVLG